MLFSVPLRRTMIVEDPLPFPEGKAAAEVLKAGDGFLFDSRRPHRFRNVGDRAAEVVSACTPPYL